MTLSVGQINDIVAGELEKAARDARGIQELPRSSLNGRMLTLEWLGQMRSFAILPHADADWLRARIASSLSGMFVLGTQPR